MTSAQEKAYIDRIRELETTIKLLTAEVMPVQYGVVRARDVKCPQCNKKWSFLQKAGFVCIDCDRTPKRLFIDYNFKRKRYLIYSDDQGMPLDSNRRALIELEKLNDAIRRGGFDPEKYRQQKDVKAFYLWNVWQDYRKAFNNENTRLNHDTAEKTIFRFFKKTHDARTIEQQDLSSLIRSMEDISTREKKHRCSFLISALNQAHGEGLLPKKLTMPKVRETDNEIMRRHERKRTSVPDISDVLKILPHVGKYKLLFLLVLTCAIRPAEARALKADCFDFENNTVQVKNTAMLKKTHAGSKTKRFPTRPIHPELVEELRQLCIETDPNHYLFHGRKRTEPVSHAALTVIWRNACKQSGVKMMMYSLKHCGLSQMAEINQYTAQKVADHQSLTMTEKYAVKGDLEKMREVISSIPI